MEEIQISAADSATSDAVSLTDRQARALGQLCKRISLRECRENSTSDDEARAMLQACEAIRELLWQFYDLR